MEFRRRDVSLIGIACFFAWSCAVNWIPTLRWVSYAFILGLLLPVFGLIALLFLTSRGSQYDATIRIQRPRSVAFLSPKAWKKEVASLRKRHTYEKKTLHSTSPSISNALDDLLEHISRDFIESWYSSISKNPTFINEVDKTMRLALGNLRDSLTSLDLTATITTRFVPILTAHFRDYSKAEMAIRGKYRNRTVTESEELDLAIAAKYNDGNLHPAASLEYSDTKLAQQCHLRNKTKELLPFLLPERILASRAASALITELIACAVLSPVMQILAEPDTWNQIMESYGKSVLQDRSTVKKLRFALDQHTSLAPRTTRKVNFPRLVPGDHERNFEKFIRTIQKVNNLSDARRFRSELSSLLKKDSQQERIDPVYLRRLEIGKRLLDQRVSLLAAGGETTRPIHEPSNNRALPGFEKATLLDLLHDTSGLTYFMEFMDRQNLLPLVQFWIVVEGFRTPLEDDFADDIPASLPSWDEVDRKDLALINDAYLLKPELKIPDSSRQIVLEFLKAGKNASSKQYYLARRAILRAQTAALELMQDEHFQNFKKSDLFYKCLTSRETSKSPMPVKSSSALPKLDSSTKCNQTPMQSSSSQSLSPTASSISRESSKIFPNNRELRRQAYSVDFTTPSNRLESKPHSRRSLDTNASACFNEDNFDTEQLNISMYSSDHDIHSSIPDKHVIKSMEAALNSIMGFESNVEELRNSLFGDDEYSQFHGTPPRIYSSRNSFEGKRPGISDSKPEKVEKPNISSLGLVNMSSRIGVFTDDDLFPDEEKFISDEHEDSDENPLDYEDVVHEAAPGDLGLAEAISALTADIERLFSQDAVVDSMTRKAELTNNTAELRILKKSKASLQREIRHKELQRRQYVIQESDNSLYGRSTVRIKSIAVGKDEDGKDFATYIIEVQRKAGEQMPAATWTINRRYSEFLELNQKLREKYASTRTLEFPRRRMVMKLQADFLHRRRLALERYLQEILLLPEICRSRELRTFLSESAVIPGNISANENDDKKKDLMTRFYNSVTDGMEDILGNIPVFDQLSVAGQNLISVASQQWMTMPATVGEDSLHAAEAEFELNAFENKELEPFVKPICDIFLEVFELNRGNNWLRGRAVVVVLHQLLGGTIERKARENIKGLCSEEAIVKYINNLRDTIWPNGQFKKEFKLRTSAEKSKSRTEASLILATLVPDLAASVVGRVNAQAASRRLFATFNNPRLNLHLTFTLFDEFLDVLFGLKTV
ncbi:PXA domain containing protein [Blumeria hordei DH14]|uniref:PXA domain containing protein n=1 Tax=Blumeria graminis f. sp. hordei (strain DH14) TaxID=546991 RepID=N1J5W4_BLUG1|nr:PXA domain containing protein [Blumeria hordei DH14]